MVENQTWIDEVPDKIVWNMYHDARNFCACHDFFCQNDIDIAIDFGFGFRLYCPEHFRTWYQ